MRWCVKYIFVVISVASLCHGGACAITRCSGMNYEQNDSLWSENAHLISHICQLTIVFISALKYNLCLFLINLFDCNSLRRRSFCKTQSNAMKTVSSRTIHSIKGRHRMFSGDKFQTHLNFILKQKVTIFYEVDLGGTYRTQFWSVKLAKIRRTVRSV